MISLILFSSLWLLFLVLQPEKIKARAIFSPLVHVLSHSHPHIWDQVGEDQRIKMMNSLPVQGFIFWSSLICLPLFTFQSPHSFCSVHAARFCICIQWERPGGTCWLHLTPSSGFFQLYSWMTLPIIFLSLTVFVVFCVKIMLPIKWVEKYIPLFKILWKNFVKTEIFTNEAKWNFLWRVLIY